MGKISFGELVNSGATPLPDSDLMTPAREMSFAEIVCGDDSGSVNDSEFVERFCSKQMLHITQDDRTRFEYLLSWQRINDLLSLNLLEEAALRVARDGRDIPPSLYRAKEGDIELVDSRKLHDLIKQNASVAINSVQFHSPPVRRLALQMELALGAKVNVNAYMTFGPGGAFRMHYDAHDVLVLQVHGSKHWFLYDEPEIAPVHHVRQGNPSPRNVVFEKVLEQGDVLYVPRGVYHRAAVTDTDSVHLTFGIHPFKALKFIDGIRKAAEDDVIFREDVVSLRGPEAFAERERMIKARLCELVNESSLMDYLEKWQLSWKPVDRFHLGPPQELDDHTVVAPLVRSQLAWRDSVKKSGKEPSVAGERILEALIEKRRATVGELKTELSGVLDEDIVKSTLAELFDDCWIEVIR
jgi:ribosomal protein L16 Arg81 hydroxylase